MIVGICKVSLYLPENHSLKEKRRLLQRIKQKSMSKFKVMIAEVGDQDLWQKAELGFAVVGSQENLIRSLIDKCIAFIEESEGIRASDEEIEVIRYS
jgi:uncharacterized protein YlxP (DUF503 family)